MDALQFDPVGNPHHDIRVLRQDRRATCLGLVRRSQGKWEFVMSREHPVISGDERAEVDKFVQQKNVELASTPAANPLLGIETILRGVAKRVETYRMTKDADSDELDNIFEALLELADQIRMIAQPITVTHATDKAIAGEEGIGVWRASLSDVERWTEYRRVRQLTEAVGGVK